MKYFVTIALICSALVGELVGAAHSSSHEWSLFKSKHGKSYEDPAEDARRFANFMSTKQRVERHNAQGSSSFKMGLNYLADWTQEELAQLNGVKVDESVLLKAQENADETEAYIAEILASSDEPVPDQLDWRQVPGRVSAVKNQGKCGSCWAFATIGALEGQEIKRVTNDTKKVVQLSEQELVDCSLSNGGCDGGLMSLAFDDLRDIGGVMSGQVYPYHGKRGRCAFSKKKAVIKDAGHAILHHKNETLIKEVLAKFGPVATGMDATGALVSYKSGILDDFSCLDKLIGTNHAVLLVGYGTDPSDGDFWIVKNSWGAEWGDQGYFKITRGINKCGIALVPTIPKF